MDDPDGTADNPGQDQPDPADAGGDAEPTPDPVPRLEIEDLPLVALQVLAALEQRHRADRSALAKDVRDVTAQVQAIEKYLDSLDAKEKPPPPPPPDPQPWRGRATVEDWRELVDWIDWLLRTYQPANEYALAPCWPAHGGAVEHLAGLHHAWKAAMLKDEHDGLNDAAAYWHKQMLWPVLTSASNAIPNVCRDTGHKPGDRVDPTDRTFLPEGVAIAAGPPLTA